MNRLVLEFAVAVLLGIAVIAGVAVVLTHLVGR